MLHHFVKVQKAVCALMCDLFRVSDCADDLLVGRLVDWSNHTFPWVCLQKSQCPSFLKDLDLKVGRILLFVGESSGHHTLAQQMKAMGINYAWPRISIPLP